MRGLLNDNIARFDSENIFGFPEVFPITEKVDCSSWVDFDTGVPEELPLLLNMRLYRNTSASVLIVQPLNEISV